jgi:4-aminobutyrate aminotransferase/(S)-3-amino-2-methylpropionate transaminase
LSHHPGVVAVRGTGYLHAVEFATPGIANKIVVEALARGVIVLQSGPTGTSITFAPPLVIGDDQLARALDIVESCVPSGGSA